MKRSPLEIAEELASALRKKDHVISDVTIAGPYLNIRVQKGLFTEQFLTSVSSLGRQEPKHETIFVDYIGTNVGKPLHIGHMCTPNQGQAMINLYKYL
ncbi:MAG: hypothetical protein H6767_03010 [Candidatus Peribacteria bacterium]|nr:MAG: hypothetical protein H6767_03010 [Candidatus Peribacteria bacterium]